MMRSALILMTCAMFFGAGCKREERNFRGAAPSAQSMSALRMSKLQPGATMPDVEVHSEYEGNAYALNEGKTLYSAMNCVGCHAHGGGGMGPALMDDAWIYGSQPAQIFATIQQGRPNGMPSFGGKISDDQLWKIVAYVQSLSGQLSSNAATGRDDHMNVRPPEQSTSTSKPKQSSTPPSTQMPQ
jgi:cytochrome c oxidase cbb3-type subunit 3